MKIKRTHIAIAVLLIMVVIVATLTIRHVMWMNEVIVSHRSESEGEIIELPLTMRHEKIQVQRQKIPPSRDNGSVVQGLDKEQEPDEVEPQNTDHYKSVSRQSSVTMNPAAADRQEIIDPDYEYEDSNSPTLPSGKKEVETVMNEGPVKKDDTVSITLKGSPAPSVENKTYRRTIVNRPVSPSAGSSHQHPTSTTP